MVGHDQEGKPIWELTPEEHQQWKQKASPARARAGAGPQQGNGDPGSQGPAAQSPQAMELGAQIWEWRKKGWSVYEIHRKLGIPMEAVKEIWSNLNGAFTRTSAK